MAVAGRRRRWRAVLRSARLNLAVLLVLLAAAVAGMALIRTALLKNAYETGTALSRTYAAEEEGNLAVYETLLTFGTTSVDERVERGEGRQELSEWLSLYFQRLDAVLGRGVVDPYLVLEGEILAANPWEGDNTYDVSSTEWYQRAVAAGGEVVFTDLYTDAISGYPVITAAQQCRNSGAVMAFDILPEHFLFGFEALELPEGNSFFLCDSTGRLIYGNTALELPERKLQGYLDRIIGQIGDGSLEDYRDRILDVEGRPRAVYYTRMDNGWYSIVTVSYDDILGAFNWFTAAFLMVIGASLLAAAGMTWREMRLSERMERTNETVRVLGNSYYALYRVDFERERYEMIKGSDYVRERIPPSGAYAELLRVAGEVIETDAYRDFVESFSSGNIRTLVRQRVRDFGGDFQRRFGEEYRWVSVRVLFDESLAPEEVVLSFREVEREKQRQLRERKLLEDSLELARKNEASKQTFFSSMSHDMRTPLNAIISLSELARKNAGDPARVQDYLSKIQSSGRHLLGLINDILDMSRMEQGKVMVDVRRFQLGPCLEECLGPFRIQAAEEGKRLTEDLPDRDEALMGDPFRIQQIMNNLLSNALKFTGEGGTISVSVCRLEGGEHVKYKFVVEDTGIGMSREFLGRVFEPYARELRFTAKQAAGTGLGMSITKNLVAQMNGEIHVESEPGAGSVFTVVLPFEPAEEEASAPQEASQTASSLEGLRVLVAEDNEINMEIVTELLAMEGVQTDQAWNGKEAVERFARSELFGYDAILMDMQMPQLDGCEAARRIRALPRADAKKVPIIALTANAFAEDIAATAAAGMDAHVSKPIEFQALRAALERLTAERTGAERP